MHATTMFSHLPVPALLLDNEQRIRQANALCCALFAMEGNRVQGSLLPHLIAISPRTLAAILDKGQDAPASSACWKLTHSNQVSVTLKTNRLDDNTTLVILDEKQVSDPLKCPDSCRHGQILETLYQESPMGILLLNHRMEILSCNTIFLEIWHLPGQIQERPPDNSTMETIQKQLVDPKRFLRTFSRLKKQPRASSRDEFLLKDGRTLLAHAIPILQQGEDLGRIWYFLDITPWKEAQQEIMVQKKLQEAVLEHIQDGIVVCNDAGRLTMVNRASKRLHDCNPGKDSGRRWKEWTRKHLFHIDGTTPLDMTQEPLAKALRGELVHNQEMAYIGDDGQRRDLCVNGQAMFDNQGNKLGAVLSFHDITDLNRAHEQLRYLAYHDLLTGLPNRRLFHDLLNQALRQARRNKEKVAVLFLDLDNFKQINDTYGHEAGDQLLLDLSTALRLILRDSDILCRWGGDEFILALPQVGDRENTIMVAGKLCAFIEEHLQNKFPDWRISTSIGIALYPDHDDSADALIRRADMAMYSAKERGKNGCYCFPVNGETPAQLQQATSSLS